VPRSELLFLGLIAAVAVERLGELALSTRNARRALASGGVEPEPRAFYAAMVAVHAAFLVAAPLEVVLFRRPFLPWLGWPMLGLTLGGMTLRYWAIATLGERWNTRLIVVPRTAAAVSGPYRYVRHPNYLAVIVELFALPLVHTAWVTALLFSIANALLLSSRIPREEAALARHALGGEPLGDRARFVPRAPRPSRPSITAADRRAGGSR
jgi:methyltransferase